MTRALLAAGVVLAAAAAQDRPVLVELFTSEGCSSCPPADALLEQFDRTQPVRGTDIIVLSEHVDYWNRIGWVDPFSSPAFSARQEEYARRFGTEGPYTPQMVVDGSEQFVGSDRRAAEAAIRARAAKPRASVRISAGDGSAIVEVDPLPGGAARKAGVYVAWAAEEASSDVARGENKGRRLHHVAVAREIKQVGSVDSRRGFRGNFRLDAGTRLVAFVQEGGLGPVWGAAVARSASHPQQQVQSGQ